jgi:hypothetical protein
MIQFSGCQNLTHKDLNKIISKNDHLINIAFSRIFQAPECQSYQSVLISVGIQADCFIQQATGAAFQAVIILC